jgi:murein DD-endopeptidase MepM/ murein hydrolase activator NlpD
VVEVVGDAPDVAPGPPDLAAVNNLVGVQVYGGNYVYLLHLRQGSVPPEVVVGARLAEGTVIGRVGNSGVSAAPHLHVVVLAFDRDAIPARTWSVPAEWRDVWIGPRRGALREWAVPIGGDYVSSEAF